MEGLTHCRWKLYSSSKLPSLPAPPEEVLIAPSTNLLSKEAFLTRAQAVSLDPAVHRIAADCGLAVPPVMPSKIPQNNHCLSASLHFIKRYRQTGDIVQTARAMERGFDREIALTTLAYNQVFAATRDDGPATFGKDRYVARVQQTVARSIQMSVSDRVTLSYPIGTVIPYLKNDLECGNYIISLPDHALSLVKEPGGRLIVFDPNIGTVDAGTADGEQWFTALLRKYGVQTREKLLLLKLSEGAAGPVDPRESTIALCEEPPKLVYEEGTGRWGTAVFEWRDKVYRMPWDKETGLIYNSDPVKLLRLKNTMLVARTWMDTAVRTVYHAAMAVFRTLALPFAVATGKQTARDGLGMIAASVKEAVRAPLYAIPMTIAALYGIFKPYDGRRLYGRFERTLNHQNDAVDFRRKYYIAPCFKPWNFGVQKDRAATVERLKATILKLEGYTGSELVDLFTGWRRALPCCR